MNKKLKIMVLMGGRSTEHEISVVSGTQVVNNLDSKKFEVLPVVISKSGETWKLTNKESLNKLTDTLKLKGTTKEIVLSNVKEISKTSSISANKIDLVFLAMHGTFGEDGTVQGMLELAGITYTGSKVLASAIGMDKEMFRKIMASENIPIPKYITLNKGDSLKKLNNYPYFVKPVNGGSSVGASIARNKKELLQAVKLSFKYDNRILVDEYIIGREFTCAVLGNNNPIALPVIEIKPLKGEFFDYESKYTESGSEEIVPAKISKKLTSQIQELSLKVYKAIGCKGFGRIDFIVKDDKKPIVLEINTIPGLTPMSLLPKAAKAYGLSYKKLLESIIKYAYE